MILQCAKVHYTYPDSPEEVLSDMTLDVPRGQVVALMGHSGCGKTTLLNILSGLIQPQRGSIHTRAERPATIFQDRRLIPWMTIAGNVRFGAREKKIAVSDTDLEEHLSNIGLSPQLKNAYPKVLSGGMQQRIALARALACKPDLLFMDEPFSALDAPAKKELMSRIAQYVEDHRASAVLVTHDREVACTLAHVIYEMRGYPLKLRQLVSVPEPGLVPGRRSDQVIKELAGKIAAKTRQKNRANFCAMAVCQTGTAVEEFVDFLRRRQWCVAHIVQEQAPPSPESETPDCIVVAGAHPLAEELVRKYKGSRFLWLNQAPPSVHAAYTVEVLAPTFTAIKDWWGWENIYADLIAQAPNTKVTDILIGHNWSFVQTAKGTGLGRTPCRGTEGPRSIADAGDLLGKSVRELAQGLTGSDDLQRSLAIAALQSAYNPRAVGRIGRMQWGFQLFREDPGEKVCVGNCPLAKKAIPDIKIIEREPLEGHYTVEQGENLLRRADCVAVTAQTLMNGSLPRILFLAQGADIMLLGPSCPLSPVWGRYGVRYACGVRVTNPQAMRNFVAQAGTMLLQEHMTETVTLEF